MNLKEYFNSEETQSKIKAIKKEFVLKNKDKEIKTLLLKVFSGEIPSERVAHLLNRDLAIPFEKALDISWRLKSQIFAPISEEISQEREKYEKKEREFEREQIEEEAEIAKIRKKTPKIKVEKIGTEEIAKEAADKTGLTLETEVLKKRFEGIISTYLRDVRDERETKEILVRSEKIGGIGLDETQADEVIDILATQKPRIEIIEKEKRVTPPKETEWAPEPPEPEEYKKMLWRIEHKPVTAVPEKEKKVLVRKPGEEVKKPEPELGTEQQPLSEAEPAKEKPPIVPSPPVEVPSFPSELPKEPLKEEEPLPSIPRPRRPEVVGPVEELKSITCQDFRRWSAEAKESAAKIKQKVDLLEKESLVKKAAGINAWKESEIYRLYLELGQQSLEKGIPVEEVIRQRTSEGKPTLTIEEFKAITALNQQLRF